MSAGRTRPCEACGDARGRLRVCTKQILCLRCRSAPDHRILPATEARGALGLAEAAFVHLRAGTTINPANPRFRRVGVYFWKDIAELCLKSGLEIPE